MSARKVLFVAYHFPPDPAVGSLRAGKVVSALRRHGHTVDVVTSRLKSEPGTSRPAEPGVRIRTIRPLPGPREWWGWLKRKRNAAPDKSEPTDPAPRGKASGWKRLLLSLVWTPDDRQGFILPAFLVSLTRAWRADLIYSTAPPFSDHLTGLLLHWFSRKRWVVELRDPWTANSWKPDNARTKFSEAIERWMERRCLRAAYRIVCVSDGIAQEIGKHLSERYRNKVVVARNGIDELSPPRRPRPPGHPIRIVHVGTFYFKRDPMPFLRALAELRNSDAPPFEVHLVGNCRWYYGSSVEEAARGLGLSDVVRFQDWVPHEEGRRITREADLLLLLAQGQPAQIPNKLYEYLGTRIPILAFADRDGESAKMLRQVGGHIVVASNDVGEIRAEVKAALDLAAGGAHSGDATRLEEWTTEAQMDFLIGSLGPEYSDS